MAGYDSEYGITTYIMDQINKETIVEIDDDIFCIDDEWLTSRFMVPDNEINTIFKFQAYKSSAHLKLQDTTIGGHRACNAPPQFTRTCDIRANDFFYPWDPTLFQEGKGLSFKLQDGTKDVMSVVNYSTACAHTGMGRFYGEALDDGAQEVYLQFGVPQFNGILDFFRSGISYPDAYIARTGQLPEVYIAVNRAVGVITAISMPGTFILSLLLKKGFDMIFGNTPYNYYYLKPAMHMYWSTVNTIVNQIATAMGIMLPSLDKEKDTAKNASDLSSGGYEKGKLKQGRAFKFDQSSIEQINKMFTDGTKIFSGSSNYIDVYSLVCRYQNRVNTAMKSTVNKIIGEDKRAFLGPGDLLNAVFQSVGTSADAWLTRKTNWTLYRGDIKQVESFKEEQVSPSFQKSWDDLNSSGAISSEGKEKEQEKAMAEEKAKEAEAHKGDKTFFESVFNTAGEFSTWVGEQFVNKWNERAKVFDATARLATSRAVFLVQPTGSTSESFSNSTGEIQTGGMFKTMGSAAHNARFNFSDGKTGSDALDGVIDAVKQIANSVIDNVTFGFSNLVRGIMQGAYMDIPKMWEDSDCSFPSITYSMDLVAPYGHPYSRLQNIVIPLSMLLAGALPLRVGKASYASPFLCSCFSQGVHHIRLGMITDLSITRGTGNLVQTIDHKTNALTVSFTVTDFGHKINAPINNSMFGGSGEWAPIIEEGTPFADYVDALAGKHISDLNWIWKKMNHRFANVFKEFTGGGLIGSQTKIAGALGGYIGDFPIISALFSHPAMEGVWNEV